MQTAEVQRGSCAFLMHAKNSNMACFPTGEISVAYSILDTLSHYTFQTHRVLLTKFLTSSKFFLAITKSMT